jgi:hypothetical protein
LFQGRNAVDGYENNNGMHEKRRRLGLMNAMLFSRENNNLFDF